MYSSDASLFGDGPSNFGLDCYEEFKRNGVKRILELGCGQGRDAIFFASKGIDVVIVAFQKFLTEQNNLRAVRVIANQNVVQAEAAARANIAKASGESQAIKIITSQLRSSPEYLQWQAINRWNGQLPYASGSSAVPFFQLPAPQPRLTNQTNQPPP